MARRRRTREMFSLLLRNGNHISTFKHEVKSLPTVNNEKMSKGNSKLTEEPVPKST